MNPFGSDENITIEGVSVKIPVLNERKDSLSSKITFHKPIWMPDNEADFCLSCNVKFSQLRRKHHCRNCGKIFCHKCCSEKISLPHFGIKEPEKVCNGCKMIVDLIGKSKSDNPALKLEAVTGFSNLMISTDGLCKVIECGGLHLMLSMTTEEDLKIKGAVAAALHNIAQNMTINPFLVEIGALKALKKLLTSACGYEEVISDSLSALNSMSMDPNIRVQVLKEGIIDPLLSIMNYTGTLAIFAARVLQLLVSNFDCHEFVLQNHHYLISKLFQALENEDYQMQTCVSKMLVYFSAGSDSYRQLILQEDISREFPLIYLLKGAPVNVLVNAVCIVANLSLSVNELNPRMLPFEKVTGMVNICLPDKLHLSNSQLLMSNLKSLHEISLLHQDKFDMNFSHQYISALCDLLSGACDDTGELLTHLGRGLANFAENASNALQLVHHLGTIISALLKSNFDIPKVHACRLIIYLFTSEPTITFDVLSQSGMGEFMEMIFSLPGINDTLNSMLLRKVSKLSICR